MGVGVNVKMVQKMIMDEWHALMNADISRRVMELPYGDPCRKSLLEILHNEFATNLLMGFLVQGVLFKLAKWKEQVKPAYHHQRLKQRKMGLHAH